MRLNILKLFPDLLPFPGNDVSATILAWQGKQYGWTVHVDALHEDEPWPQTSYDVILLGSSFTHIPSKLLQSLKCLYPELHAQIERGALFLVSGISSCLVTEKSMLPNAEDDRNVIEIEGLSLIKGHSELIAPAKSGWITVRSSFVSPLVVGELYRHCLLSVRPEEKGEPFGEIASAISFPERPSHHLTQPSSETFLKILKRKFFYDRTCTHEDSSVYEPNWRHFGWVRSYGQGKIIVLPWVGAYLSYNPHLVSLLLSMVANIRGESVPDAPIDSGFSWEAYHHIIKRIGLSDVRQ